MEGHARAHLCVVVRTCRFLTVASGRPLGHLFVLYFPHLKPDMI